MDGTWTDLGVTLASQFNVNLLKLLLVTASEM
jgi:hypothetical protein